MSVDAGQDAGLIDRLIQGAASLGVVRVQVTVAAYNIDILHGRSAEAFALVVTRCVSLV